MDTSKIIGMTDGKLFTITKEAGRGKTKTHPSFKNGKRLKYDHPEYWNYKTTVEVETIRFEVNGNPVRAESHLKDLKYNAFSNTGKTVDVYTEDI